jgi:PKHD-type hydroxylase
MKFDFVYLGQTVLKYEVPLEIFVGLNEIYEKQKKQLPSANKQLVGKIEDEVSLYYSGPNNDKMHQHCFLPQDILQWFHSVFDHYTDWNKIGPTQKNINSIWVNEMKAHEYNPVHIHQGKLYTGLSSVMILKLPKETGVEYSSPQKPMNGRLQIIGAANGQFAKTDYSPNMKIGDFYVFPYDMRHCVYPFNGTKEKRRTLVCNVDVDYNPVVFKNWIRTKRMIPRMPRWQSYVAQTTQPIFTPEQCKMIIDAGHQCKPEEAKVGGGEAGKYDTKKRVTTISWIPFDKLPQMYKVIENQLSIVNLNHFYFDGVKLTEPAQFTVYPKKGFYDWHMDLNAFGQDGQNPIRKISMTLLLSDPSEFTGGELTFSETGDTKPLPLKQGQAIFFASFLRHKVAPVKKGVRKSLVMWFGGPPFK